MNYAAPYRDFLEAIKTCFQKIVTFKGRASRSEFWWFWLFVVLAGVAFEMLAFFANATDWYSETFPVRRFFWLAIYVTSWSVSVRRLHDLNLSGWWFLLYMVVLTIGANAQIVYIVWLKNLMVVGVYVLFAFKGKPAANKYDAVISESEKSEERSIPSEPQSFPPLPQGTEIDELGDIVPKHGAPVLDLLSEPDRAPVDETESPDPAPAVHRNGVLKKAHAALDTFVAGASAAILLALWALTGLGGIYWLWEAIQIKSFGMFLAGIFLPFVTAPVGGYMLIFGTPNWVLSLFG